MNTQKILRVALVASLLVAGTAAHAAEESQKKATQLLDKHYYESAAAALRAGGGAEADPVAALTLARAYARNAELYRALQRSSLAIGAQYLQKLAAQGGRDRSQFAALYYGEYLIAAGKLNEGGAQLRRFLGQQGIAASYRDIAQADLAVVQHAAPPAPAGKDALVRTQFAAALGASAAHRADAVAQMDQALADLAKANPVLPVRALTNAIGVYARGGQPQKAVALLASADLGRPSYEETIGKDKVLRFYDPALLGNLAELNAGESERLLQRVRNEARFKPVATYFLVELYLNAEQFSKAVPLMSELAAAADLPAAYRDRVAIMQAALDARTGKGARATAAFAELGKKYAQDPVLLAEVQNACVRFKASCASVAASARTLAATSQGERFRNLHFAVGEQYAAERKNDRALLEMETARDKSNKNRVDTNDPLLLVRLADLYFASKSFSESLEIYFEMSKEFASVRQLQETGQGVYSTEYRSAGDAKIF